MSFFSIIIHLIKQRTHFTTWTSEGDKVYFCDLRFTSRWIKASWEKNMAEKKIFAKKNDRGAKVRFTRSPETRAER